MTSIAVDAMSGDNDPAAAAAASLRMAAQHPDMRFFLCGRRDDIERAMDAAAKSARLPRPDNIAIENAAEVAAMKEHPKRAIRRRDTSMRRAMDLLADNRAQAMVSAGNTGALLGIGMLTAGAVEGIHRPAIASFMPNVQLEGGCCLLDLGANVECTADMLRQFGLMGAALTMAVRGVKTPKVALLNVGEENFKGGERLREAAKMLEAAPGIEFTGNAEGFDIYLGDCDVIVCDGFTGNVALKVSEGLARMISGMIKKEFRRDMLSRTCGALAYPVLSRLRSEMDARRYNGACFLGMRGLAVKSHGGADDVAFYSALNYAAQAARQNLAGITESIIKASAAA